MTCLALYTGMLAGKRKAGAVVIEIYVRPAGWFVTRTAVGAELTVVFVVASMTGVTIRGRPFEHAVGMTFLTLHARMRANEREARAVVVKGGVLPTTRVVASRTDRAKLPVVGIVSGVTGDALLRRPLVNAVRMAGGTFHSAMRAGKREARAAVVEIHIFPGDRIVTSAAVRSKLTIVFVVRGVAGKTIGRRPLEPAAGVTGGTGGSLMRPNQFESRLAMIEMHILPVERSMAFGAIHAHLPLVNIHMAGSAGGRRAFEGQVAVAFCTGNVHVPADQRKSGFGMVKGNILPGGCLVAGGAICSQHALMRVILSVAGEAIGGRAFEEHVGMARPAGDVHMRLREFESRTVMVKLGWRPAFRRMAGGAVPAQHPLMRIVVHMARGAILRQQPEVHQVVSAAMALFACYFAVFTAQLELKSIVIEAGHHAVVTVVTLQTGLPIRKDVLHHECLVALTVTRLAGLDIERSHIASMTIRAFERFILRLELVRRQKISRYIMRILPPFYFGEGGGLAAVFGMTGAAFRRRVNGVHTPVRRHQILHLSRNILMADDTAVLHGLRFPWGNVAGTAGAGNLCM